MRTLLTGGSGFIGSHLAEKLLAQGDEVIILDNLSTGSMDNLKNINNPNCEFHHGSVIDGDLVESLVNRVDRVFHLAATVGVKLVVDRPLYTIENNLIGTNTVLECAVSGKKPVLITSTSEVYGKSKKYPHCEDDDIVIGPSSIGRWGYACSKATDEFLALAYHKEHGLPVIVTRLFNTTGPRQSSQYGMVLPRFVQQAVDGKDLTVFGSGNQTRSFAHVSDVTSALIKLMEHPKAVGRVFNVGSEEEISISQLAYRVAELSGKPHNIKYIPYDEVFKKDFEDTMRRVPDLTRLKEEIGYKPMFTCDQIIEDTIEYYRGKNG